MGKIKVSNGKEQYEIDPSDLKNAMKDGYKEVKQIPVTNGKEVLYIDDSDLENAMKDGYVKKKDGTNGLPTSSDGESSSTTLTDKDIPDVKLEGSLDMEDPVAMAQRADRLSQSGEWSGTGGTGGGGGSFSPNIEDVNKSAELKNKIKEQYGVDADELINDFKDYPADAAKYQVQGEDGTITTPYGTKEMAKLKTENTVKYSQLMSTIKNQYTINLRGGVEKGNEYNALNNKATNLSEWFGNKTKQLDIINSTLTDEERDKAKQRLEIASAPVINTTNPDLLNEYKNSDLKGIVNPDQYAGLKTLELFKPEEYKQAIGILKSNPQHEYEFNAGFDIRTGKEFKETRETQESIDKQQGLESLGKKLLDIGRGNSIAFSQSKIAELAKASQTATPDQIPVLQEQYAKYKGNIDSIYADAKKDDEKFPISAQLKFDNQVKDITQDSGTNPFAYGAYRFGKGFETTGNSLNNIKTAILGSDKDNAELQAQRLGESQREQSEQYLPTSLQSEQPNVITRFPKEVKDAAKAIFDNGDWSDETKKYKIDQLLKDNKDKIDTITNPDAGKHKNFFSKATVYGNAGMIGDIASIAAQSYGLGAAGVGKFIQNAAPLFTTTQDSFYKQAVADGNPDPSGYANSNALIMALAGTINPKLDVVKRAVGLNTVAGKALAGIDEATWNSVVNENKPLLERFANAGKNVLKEGGKMAAVYGAGTSIAGDLLDKVGYNKPISNDEILNHALKSTKDILFNSAALLGVGAISNFKSVPIEQKAKLWDLGDNKEIGLKQIEDAKIAGEITPQQAESRKNIVNNISKIIEKVPTEDSKGKPLTDKKRLDYFYNALVKSKATEDGAALPKKQKEEMEHTASVADHDNAQILDPKTDSELQSRKNKLESLLEPKKDEQGKVIELPEKEKKEYEAELESVKSSIHAHERAIELSEKLKQNAEPKSTEIDEIPNSEKEASLTIEQPDKIIEPTEGGEEKTTGIKKAITIPERVERKLEPIALPKMGADAEVLAKAKESVDNGDIIPREVIERVNKTKGIFTPDEAGAVLYYKHQLTKAETNIKTEINSHPPDSPERATAVGKLGQISDEMDALTEASRVNSRAWGNLGNVMQIETDQNFSPSSVRTIIKENYGGEIPKEVQSKLDEALKMRDAAIEELRQAKEKLAANEIKKSAEFEQRKNKRKSTKDELKIQRESIIEEIKKSIKKDLGNINSGIPIPTATLTAIGKLAVNYFKDGIVTLEGLTDKIHNDLKSFGYEKKAIREAISNYQHLRDEAQQKEMERLSRKESDRNNQVASGEPKKEPQKSNIVFKKTNEILKAESRIANAEHLIKEMKRKSFESQKNWYQKGLMWAARLSRLSVLSGYNVLGKLAAAATVGAAGKRIPEQAIGKIYSIAFKGIAEKAPIEGYINAKSEAAFYKEFFNPKKFLHNSWQILKTGESYLSKKHGAGEYEHVPILYLPTDLHQIIKDPVKRATFDASFRNSLIWAEKNGLDINDDLVIQSLETAAYKRALYEIFQESNKFSRAFTEWKNKIEKGEGKVLFMSIPDKNAGATAKFIADFLIPVSSVPTNIVRRLITTSPFGLIRGSKEVIHAYRKGIENLTPEQANHVMQQLKQGSLGTALWLIGWFSSGYFGGLYSKYDPDKKKKSGELLHDQMSINGKMIPKPAQHALPLEIIQFAATARHVYDNYIEKGNSVASSLANAALSSIGELADEVPIVETGVNLLMATKDPYHASRLKENLESRAVPQILKETGLVKKEEEKKKKKTGNRHRGSRYTGR